MPRFEPNRPIVTTEPTVLVEELGLGQHAFQLVVEDQDGNRSAPDQIIVTVVRL
jgi:hypothetical protein